MIFPFFATKLGRCLEILFFIFCERSSLTAKTGKQRKTNFGKIHDRFKIVKSQVINVDLY